MQTRIELPSDEVIEQAANFLKNGDVVAFPTETVYGLGASVFNETAIQKIFEVKGRPSDNPLIVHISSLSQVPLLAQEIPPEFDTLADFFFPGPLTLVLKKTDKVPLIASAQLSTIGIRMPDHQVAWKLIEAVGTPLVAPSANLSGKPSPTTAAHVYEDLQDKIPMIIDGGPCSVGIESTVVDLTTLTPTILRPGHITKDQLEKALGRPVVSSSLSKNEPVKAPGMKYRHYAPNANITILTSLQDLVHIVNNFDIHSTLLLSNIHLPINLLSYRTEKIEEKTLYSLFRMADLQHVNNILIFLDEETRNNKGLVNRIEKAATKR